MKMKLFSEVPIQPSIYKINHQSKILCIGSCFAAEMGQRLMDAEFQAMVNPFGTQFHPMAIENTFNRIYAREHYLETEIFHHQGLYFSWDHSTLFSNPKKEIILTTINEKIDEANSFLSETDVLIFTFGTAWAYYLTQGAFFVSNCHKIPQVNFEKRLLSPKEVYDSIKKLILKVFDVLPHAKIIFTISPVRHIRDGFRENNVSKGILHTALHQVLQEFSEVQYFPSYEVVLDELRDYRYYADGLAHLNDLGLQYVWNKFSASYFSEETISFNNQIEKIQKAVAHKPVNPTSMHHKKFLYETLKKALELKKHLNASALNEEIQILKNQIHVD
ncbi:GSCFA domain-containing protein [Flavobacteriaceae bacterium Ap0902]|nr:GSCFA domain-containing protein [Flavobacteriaceae bacterium Ap0902]